MEKDPPSCSLIPCLASGLSRIAIAGWPETGQTRDRKLGCRKKMDDERTSRDESPARDGQPEK